MAKKIKEEEKKALGERKKRHGPPPPKYQPNLTPLIDVLFLLLLFFLLGTKFRQEEGQIPGTLPQLGQIQGPTADLPPQVRVLIDPLGLANENASYVIVGNSTQIMNADDLFGRLSGLHQEYGKAADDMPVVIRARGDVRWEFVVEAFNQAARAKFKNIAFDAGG